MGDTKTPKPGEWWITDDGNTSDILYVIGIDLQDNVHYQTRSMSRYETPAVTGFLFGRMFMSEKQAGETPVDRIVMPDEPSVAIKWLLLSNLKNRWPYSANIRQEAADVGMQWAIDNGLVNEGRITGSGEIWLMTH